MIEKQASGRWNVNEHVQQKKEFRNPSIYEKLIRYHSIKIHFKLRLTFDVSHYDTFSFLEVVLGRFPVEINYKIIKWRKNTQFVIYGGFMDLSKFGKYWVFIRILWFMIFWGQKYWKNIILISFFFTKWYSLHTKFMFVKGFFPILCRFDLL